MLLHSHSTCRKASSSTQPTPHLLQLGHRPHHGGHGLGRRSAQVALLKGGAQRGAPGGKAGCELPPCAQLRSRLLLQHLLLPAWRVAVPLLLRVTRPLPGQPPLMPLHPFLPFPGPRVQPSPPPILLLQRWVLWRQRLQRKQC